MQKSYISTMLKIYLNKSDKEITSKARDEHRYNGKMMKVRSWIVHLRQGVINEESIQGDRKHHFILIENSMYSENITVVKFYEPYNGTLKYIKQKVLEI